MTGTLGIHPCNEQIDPIDGIIHPVSKCESFWHTGNGSSRSITATIHTSMKITATAAVAVAITVAAKPMALLSADSYRCNVAFNVMS